MNATLRRAEAFCSKFGLRAPILLAPMASTCPPALSVAVANAGGLGGCGALMMQPDEIATWAQTVRAGSNGAFQINTWIPDPAPVRDPVHEERVRDFLAQWGPAVPPEAGDAGLPDFETQCQAILDAGPTVISSIMGLYPPTFVAAMRARGIAWFAAVTTVAEARAAEKAGADAVVAQGAEAGGHRGSFEASEAERLQVGLFSLVPAVADAVAVPVVAAGGIADARGVAAALTLGASAVQIGTGFLRCPEAGLHPAYAYALGRALPEDTILTRAFTGRAARSLTTDYVRAAASDDAPSPAPYPVQRALVAKMRAQAQAEGDVQRMQTWAGQSAGLASTETAGEVVRRCWDGARALLS